MDKRSEALKAELESTQLEVLWAHQSLMNTLQQIRNPQNTTHQNFQLRPQVGIQSANDSNKPVHSYNRGVRLGVVPILSFGCGFMLLALACVFAYVEGVDWPTVAVGIFGLFSASIGVSLFIAPMLRCPSCKKDGAITWDEYMALSKLRDNIILHNRNNPSINDPVAAATAAARLLYRCKHYGYEWIYQYV